MERLVPRTVQEAVPRIVAETLLREYGVLRLAYPTPEKYAQCKLAAKEFLLKHADIWFAWLAEFDRPGQVLDLEEIFKKYGPEYRKFALTYVPDMLEEEVPMYKS